MLSRVLKCDSKIEVCDHLRIPYRPSSSHPNLAMDTKSLAKELFQILETAEENEDLIVSRVNSFLEQLSAEQAQIVVNEKNDVS